MTFYNRGKVKVPFEPRTDLIGAIILVAIPDDCWKGEQVKFRITVNATMAFEETDSNNNSVQSSCTANP